MSNSLSNKNKKAQVSISFNWILILIAGAGILIFFIFVITKESDSSTQKINYEVSKRMESLLTAVEQNPSSLKKLGYFSTEFEFECTNGVHEYKAKNSNTRDELESQLMFSPKALGNAEVYAWTKDFNVPYPVSSVLYLSDDLTLYVFVDVPSVLPAYFPQGFQIVTYPSVNDLNTNFNAQGYRNIVLIVNKDEVIGNSLSISNNAVKKLSSIVAVPINPSGYPVTNGEVEFFEFTSPGTTSNALTSLGTAGFSTPEMLLGAIVSGDADLYSCGVEKILERTLISDEINKIRVEEFRDLSVWSTICKTYYNYASTAIAEKKLSISTLEDYNLNGYSVFYTKIEDLKRLNTQMLRASCPVMY